MTEELLRSLPEKLQETYDYYVVKRDISKFSMNDIILQPSIKEEVGRFIKEYESREKFYEYDLTNENRILSYGASGTGKTFLAECFSGQYKLDLLTVDLARVISAGNAYAELSAVFDLARRIPGSVIFLDECDQIARRRGDLNNDTSIRKLINGLFKLMDSLDKTNICMAATNLEEQLDRAFMRRFPIKLKFYRPELNYIDETIEKFINPKFTYTKDADEKIRNALLEAAKNYTSLSFAEIETWVHRAEKEALMQGRREFTQREVYGFLMRSMGYSLHETEIHGEYLYQQPAGNM